MDIKPQDEVIILTRNIENYINQQITGQPPITVSVPVLLNIAAMCNALANSILQQGKS